MAVFINEGKLADVFKPGTLRAHHPEPADPRHAAGAGSTASTARSRPRSISAPRASSPTSSGARPGPAMMRDKDFGMVRATAFGLYAIRVKDAGVFVKDLVGTDNRFTTEEIQENLRGKIGARIKELMPELGIPGHRPRGQGDRAGHAPARRASRPTSRAWASSWSRCRCRTSACPRRSRRRSTSAAPWPPSATCRPTRSTRRPRPSATRPTTRAAPPARRVGLGAGVAMGAQMINAMAGAAGMGGAGARRGAAADPGRAIVPRRGRAEPAGRPLRPGRAAAAGRERASSRAPRSCGRRAWRSGRRRARCPSSRALFATCRRRSPRWPR